VRSLPGRLFGDPGYQPSDTIAQWSLRFLVLRLFRSAAFSYFTTDVGQPCFVAVSDGHREHRRGSPGLDFIDVPSMPTSIQFHIRRSDDLRPAQKSELVVIEGQPAVTV
jgi:hypothetical protein